MPDANLNIELVCRNQKAGLGSADRTIHQELDQARCPLSLVSTVDMKLNYATLPGMRRQSSLATIAVCYVCLLTCDMVLQRIFQNPVVAADGHTRRDSSENTSNTMARHLRPNVLWTTTF